jgi:hypothetical protein
MKGRRFWSTFSPALQYLSHQTKLVSHSISIPFPLARTIKFISGARCIIFSLFLCLSSDFGYAVIDTFVFCFIRTAKMEETRDLARQVQASLKRLNNAASSMGTPAERKERKAVVDKLTKDFSQFNDRVSTQLSLLKQQIDKTPIRPQASGGNGFFRGGSQFQQPAYGGGGGYQASYVEQDDEQERIGLIRAAQQQEYYQVEQEADHNRTIIAEREDAIRRTHPCRFIKIRTVNFFSDTIFLLEPGLRSDMQEVHEVFRDLATLVGEQGEMIGTS